MACEAALLARRSPWRRREQGVRQHKELLVNLDLERWSRTIRYYRQCQQVLTLHPFATTPNTTQTVSFVANELL